LFLKVLLATLLSLFPSVRLLNMQFLLVFATFDCCGEKGAEGLVGFQRGRGREESGAAAAAITTTNSENSGDKDKSQQWIISGT